MPCCGLRYVEVESSEEGFRLRRVAFQLAHMISGEGLAERKPPM
jgi:hypothetical protein